MKATRIYSVTGLLRLIRDKLFTLIFFPHCRLIRYPFYIRGRKYIQIGKGLTTGVNTRLDAFPQVVENKSNSILTIGVGVEINDYVHIAAVEQVVIGDNVLIASKVFISDHNHGS
jgi:lipopolysaccharide O-acetyltransferase